MGRENLPGNSALHPEDGFWKLIWSERSEVVRGGEAASVPVPNHNPHPVWVGSATCPNGVSREEGQQIVWRMIVSQARAQKAAQHSSMTLAEYVERKFVPEYVASKGF